MHTLYLYFAVIRNTVFLTQTFTADLKEELEKEKESQNAIRKRIEEETKTTGKDMYLYLYFND